MRAAALALAFLAASYTPRTLAQVAVPPELRGWEGWALQGHETHRCPWLVPGTPEDNSRICAWPSVLELQVDEHGGRFTQRWEAAADTWVPLPGSAENWPEDVTVDSRAAAVVSHNAAPAVRVAAGVHTLAAAFHWTRRPATLAVPESVGLVTLSIGAIRIANPQRTDAGIVLGPHALARQDDHVDVRVFRLLDDDLPARLRTEVHISVAGEAREIRLPSALPEGFQPTGIESPLAARLDSDNTLRVQVRPGDFTVTLDARGPSPAAEVRAGKRGAPWPAEEVWSFRSNDRLRVAAVEGVAAVDPAQADVPTEWRNLPAYRVGAGTTLRVVERSRGLSAADGNELQLQRTAWLDFGGKGYTIVDRLSGAMRQGWRLDLAAPYSLRSARRTSGDPLLVTTGLTPGRTGMELRDSVLDLTTVSRIERAGGAMPATGWDTRFTEVSGSLVLAPGYRLLAAFGPDSAPQAWLERWGLLDVFVVLLTSIVAWRLLGVRAAIIAFAASVLTHHEFGAPTWLWLAALVALALQRAAPAGRPRQWAAVARVMAIGFLVLTLVPFAIRQVRLAVYPQLEAVSAGGYVGDGYLASAANPAPGRYAVDELAKDQARLGGRTLGSTREFKLSAAPVNAPPVEETVVTAARLRSESEFARYEPGAVIQAGPGVPGWTYHVYPFSWSGAVEENATARFLISPPWMTRLWRLAGMLLSALFLLELTGRDLPTLPTFWRQRASAPAALMLAAAALTSAMVPAARAATTPDPELLEQLRGQLLAAPKCAPDCAALLHADVTVSGARLSVLLTVSALDTVGIALPGADPAWAPDLVQVDGAGPGWIQRSSRGIRYVSLVPGRHLVRIEGALEPIPALRLTFPLLPQLVDVHAPEWDIGGLSERHLVSGALELARKRALSTSAAAGAGSEEFAPFVAVNRLFRLSRDWTVATTVTRVAPKSAAFTVSLPLLPAEAITTPGLQASDATLTVGLAAGEGSKTFYSTLPRTDTLALRAAADGTHSERWQFEVAPTWHPEFNGVPAVAPEQETANWIFEYYPRPGEELTVKVTRPPASPGGTLAFDGITLETIAGARSSDTNLQLRYRSTQGGRQTLHIPADAAVTQVLSDGQPIALRPERGELSLSALPGAHTWSVSWRSPAGVGTLTRSPQISQGAPASNLRVSMRLPENRWVLYAFGPGVGPAVLYWGELLLFIAAAWWVGRSKLGPLPARDWLLLGLGLSTFSWLVLAFFAVFIALFHWRAQHPAPVERRRFNALQVLSALVAVVAILAVVAAVPQGLLAHPDMRIEPSGMAGELSWFVDQAADQLPTPAVLSISLWWYKLAILAWALWLSFALTRWTRWGWEVFTREGLWRRPGQPAPPGAQAALS